MRTGALTSRALRERALGKALLLVAVLVAAFLVSRSCGSSEGAITKDEAVEIARREVDYEPDGVQVRNLPRGIPQRRVWAVSLYVGRAAAPRRITVVEVDAETGEVRAVHDERG